MSRCWADDFNFSDTDQHISIQARPGQYRSIMQARAGQTNKNKNKIQMQIQHMIADLWWLHLWSYSPTRINWGQANSDWHRSTAGQTQVNTNWYRSGQYGSNQKERWIHKGQYRSTQKERWTNKGEYRATKSMLTRACTDPIITCVEYIPHQLFLKYEHVKRLG